MILHDVCDLKFLGPLDSHGDPTGDETIPGIPVEFSPMNSTELASTGTVQTLYVGYLSVDPSALAAGLSFTPSKVEVWFMGSRLQVEAGFERHRVLGRFHHVEFVVADFGRFGYDAS